MKRFQLSIRSFFLQTFHSPSPGGGTLNICPMGCAIFPSFILTYFSKKGVSKRAIYLKPLVKTSQKGKIC